MPHVGKGIRTFLVMTCAFTCSVAAMTIPEGSALAAPRQAATTPALPRRGDSSPQVAKLQTLLIAAGVHVSGGADGIFGPATTKAVATFQRAKGLSATGVVDAATAVAVGLRPPTPVLAPGATGTKVATLQRELIAVGLRPRGGADGAYGPGTAASVRMFQARQRLTATGALDAYTAAVLAAKARQSTTSTGGPSNGGTTSTDELRLGSVGPAVKVVQQLLIKAGTRPRGGVDGVFGPATVAAVKVFQRWNGLPATGVVDTRTGKALRAAAGTATATELDHFPLPRTCMFWDTWGAPRAGGRRHEGTDIFATRGAPIYAVADGRITRLRFDVPGSRGGNQFWLTGKDGTSYFYGHLDGFASGMGVGVPVHAGDVIGYAGKTGLTTVVHLHFEVHPHGGAPVNPYRILLRTAGCGGGQ